MAISDVLYSSRTEMWETPQAFFDELDEIFNFTEDACAIAENAKCARYITPEQDALKCLWGGVVWCNPPYGKDIEKWMYQAWLSSENTAKTVVCLVHARTDTRWWHNWVTRATRVEFVKGRLKFGGSSNSAPFPSAIVVFGDLPDGYENKPLLAKGHAMEGLK